MRQVYAKEMAEAGGVSADYATQVALDTYLADRQVHTCIHTDAGWCFKW